jgi:hypothetical protein
MLGELVALADKFGSAGLLDGGAASALHTVQDAGDVAKRECDQAVESALNRGLTVSADGRVSLPADTSGLDVELLEFYRDDAQRMIDDAVEAATQADEAVRSALTDLKVDPAYFDYADGAGVGEVDGQAHHAALVTGVLPDGEVLYTQHTPGAQSSSLQGRLPKLEQSEGGQQITVVRPRQTW